MMILSVSVTITIVVMVTDTDSIIICSDILLLGWWQTLTVSSSFVQTFYCCDGDRHWQYHHHLFRHFIVGMVTDTDNIIIICSDILLLWWWQTLTISSSFVQTFYCWDGDRHWQYHHHLFRHFTVGRVTDIDNIIIICSDILLLGWWQILTVSSLYCECLSPSQQ
jgi:hypothetical protein